MKNDIPITLVFLDTSIYISSNFNSSSRLFEALKKRIDDGQVRVGITEITIGEVESNIHADILAEHQAIEKTKSKIKILRNSKNIVLQSFFREWSKKEIESEIISKFKDYLESFQVNILGYDDVDIGYVFNLYFEKKAPFGEAKKKNEFPDAFVLKILEDWADSENNIVFVVSEDSDMKNGVDSYKSLKHVPSLAELLSNLSLKYDELAPLCIKAYKYAKTEIEQMFKDEFIDRGFYLDDQQGDVDEVFDIEIDDYNPSLLSLEYEETNNEVACEFEIITNINFKADITYDDLSTASYDSEDKVLIPWERVSETVTSSELVMVNVKIIFSRNEFKEYEIENIQYDLPDSIHVTSSVGEDWPYK